MADLLGDPGVMTYYPHPLSRAEAQTWIDWNGRLYADRGFGLWALVLGATGEFLGDCGLTPQRIEGVDEVEVGYHVRTRHQGLGYATEAAAACRDAARDRYGVRRLVAIVHPSNRPSQRVAEKIGLRVEKRACIHGEERLIYAAAL